MPVLRAAGLASILVATTIVPAAGQANGPGDPVVVRAEGLGHPIAVIADPFGDLIVSDRDASRVWRVTTDGRQLLITGGVPNPSGLGWDIYSNLLIIAPHAVYKKLRGGAVTQLLADDGLIDMALAPDGTLWFTDQQPASLKRFDALGRQLALRPLPPQRTPDRIAVNQAGEIYFTSNPVTGGSQMYKVTSPTDQELVFSTAWRISDFAFNERGDFFVTSDVDNHVYRYNQFGIAMDAPLATATVPTGIAFGRNADGAMNGRLFVVESAGRLLELAQTASPEVGAPIGFATVSQVIGELLKPGSALTEAQRKVLDDFGNRNGRYDVGDLHSFFLFSGTIGQVYAN